MSVQAAAQRKSYKGKYRGPDRFKGDKTKLAAYRAEKAKGNPNPTMASGPESYDAAGNVIPVASSTTIEKPEKPATSENTFNPGTATAVGARMTGDYKSATRKYKGKYAGPDKYKGKAPAGGKWKGKYIGRESRKGIAAPTVTPSNAGTQEEVVKRLLGATP